MTGARTAGAAITGWRELPVPPTTPPVGNMWEWTFAPLRLLAAGARGGPVCRLRLWRPTVLGYRPEWNRAVLSDLETFRSHGSLSGLTPYLAGGVVHTDPPAHGPLRQALNPHFHARSVRQYTDRFDAVVERLRPPPVFEAATWAATVVRHMLNEAFFGGRVPDRLLHRFLRPLHRAHPAPLLPRPRLFGRLEAAIAAVVADPPPGTLAEVVGRDAGTPPGRAGSAGDAGGCPHATVRYDPVEQLRVALAAGYDTTAHTLAFGLWRLAGARTWQDPAALPAVIDEVLRLYPAGWIGSRVAHRDTEAAGVAIPAGTMVLYSPYLTHRDPQLWSLPERFRPQRFDRTAASRPAWGFLPFAAGRRTCLGAALARLMLRCAFTPVLTGELVRWRGDPTIEAGITLRPRGPLWLALGR